MTFDFWAERGRAGGPCPTEAEPLAPNGRNEGVGACQSGVGLRVGSQNGGQKTRKAAFESGLDERNENDPYCIKEAVRGYLAPGGQRQRGLAPGEALLKINIEVVLIDVKRFFPKMLIEKSIWCNL